MDYTRNLKSRHYKLLSYYLGWNQMGLLWLKVQENVEY